MSILDAISIVIFVGIVTIAIAIVGRACLLPGADSPEALWSLVRERRSGISVVPEGRWGVARDRIVCAPDARGRESLDHTWSDRGGYVREFEFDPRGFEVAPETFEGLDPVFTWSAHTARAALDDYLRASSAAFAQLDEPRLVLKGVDPAPTGGRTRAWSGVRGQGLEHILVWRFRFKEPGAPAVWAGGRWRRVLPLSAGGRSLPIRT